MALSGTFAVAGVSATITGLVGNVAISLNDITGGGPLGGGFHAVLEASYDAGTTYVRLHDFGNNQTIINKVLVSPDGTTIYRIRLLSMPVASDIKYYMGQEAAA